MRVIGRVYRVMSEAYGLLRMGASRRVASRPHERVHSAKAPPPPVVPKGCVGRVMSRRVEWNAHIRGKPPPPPPGCAERVRSKMLGNLNYFRVIFEK